MITAADGAQKISTLPRSNAQRWMVRIIFLSTHPKCRTHHLKRYENFTPQSTSHTAFLRSLALPEIRDWKWWSLVTTKTSRWCTCMSCAWSCNEISMTISGNSDFSSNLTTSGCTDSMILSNIDGLNGFNGSYMIICKACLSLPTNKYIEYNIE